MSHLTYVRQKSRDHGVPLEDLTLEVTDHDRERAEDIVAELERLGVYDESGAGHEPEEPEDREPPEVPESPPRGRRGEPVTDIWGNPVTVRRGRRR